MTTNVNLSQSLARHSAMHDHNILLFKDVDAHQHNQLGEQNVNLMFKLKDQESRS